MENNNKKFLDIKEDILRSLNSKMENGEIKIHEKVTLVDGFFMQSFQDNLLGIEIGGRTVPSIMLVGASGQIYLFALKAILPDLKF